MAVFKDAKRPVARMPKAPGPEDPGAKTGFHPRPEDPSTTKNSQFAGWLI